MNEKKKYQALTGNRCKALAMIMMFLDHFAVAILKYGISKELFGEDSLALASKVSEILRNIGRSAFPIFAFLLVEGFFHTKNQKIYAKRLVILALVSEILFDFAIWGKLSFHKQNTVVTLLIGLFTIWACELWKYKDQAMRILFLLLGCGVAYLGKTDYGYRGIILIFIFYLLHEERILACILGYFLFLYEPWSAIGFLLILCYNGERGWEPRGWKKFTYGFYPIHLFLLIAMRFFIF